MGKSDRPKGNQNSMTNSIIKRQSIQKKELLEKLKETPVVEVACRKIGIARATYYRWRLIDEKFAEEADTALSEGSSLVNDMAESQLLSAIKDQNMTAIIFWLKHHHEAYKTKVEVDARLKMDKENLTPEQDAMIKNALKLAGLIPIPETIEGGKENDI